MKETTSKITKSNFSNEWTNPSGGITYYFDLVFENGMTGSIGVQDKNSDKIKVGNDLTFSIVNNKIKVAQMSNNSFKPQAPSTSTRKTYTNSRNSKEQYLGFTWGYAKDLIIAGKSMKDVEELKKVANFIYNEIGEMLENSNNQ